MKEEITAREFIEIILNGWKCMVLFVFSGILIAGILSYYVMDPIYEAKTILMAPNATESISGNNIDGNDLESILDSIATYPSMTIQTYKEQIKSSVVLQKTIAELELEEVYIDINKLREMISLETVKDTNLITVTVSNSDPEVASKIANTVAENFTMFITEMSTERASSSSNILKTQLELEKVKLDESLLELKRFLSQPRGVDELYGEVDSILSMLNNYKTQIVQKEVMLSKLIAGVTAIEKEMLNTPETLIVEKSLDNEPLLNQLISGLEGVSITDVSQIVMKSEEINENYLVLELKAADFRISIAETENEISEIKTRINDYQKKLEVIQQELAGKSYEKTLIDNKINLSQEAYDAFSEKYEELLITESTKIGESSIDIVSYALIPTEPIGPRKVVNIVIGLVIGLMLGVFIVFFRAYWKATSTPPQ